MGAQAKRGAKGAKGGRRGPVLQTGCLHTNAAVEVTPAIWPTTGIQGPYRVRVQCPECGRSEALTDVDAGPVLALIGGR